MLDRLFHLWSEAMPGKLENAWQGPNTKPTKQPSANNGLAYLEIAGTLLYRQTKFDFGSSMSYSDIVAELDALRTDETVNRVLVTIDSPGGSAAGVHEAWKAMRALSAAKPVVVHTPAILGSAAYYLASGANKIVAAESAIVGSIGTFVVLSDLSKLISNAGIDLTLVSSGGVKGQSTPGLPVTQELVDQTQKIVDTFAAQFINAVAIGRKMDPKLVTGFATGHVWIGVKSVQYGLTDAVGSLSDAAKQLMSMAAPLTLDDQQMAYSHYPLDELKTRYEQLQQKYSNRVAEVCPRFHAHYQAEVAKLPTPKRMSDSIKTRY